MHLTASAEITLSPRLLTAAAMARPGAAAADIGTDHAYIPAYLVSRGICPRAIACDIRQGPLENARATLKKYHLEEKIALRLCDGLANVSPGEAEDIYICGMGGDAICEIISGAPWLKDKKSHLILQPMTRAVQLRAFLFTQGYSILDERAVTEGRHCYTVILAAYTGQSIQEEADDIFLYIGMLSKSPDDHARRYIRMQAQRLEKKAFGLQKSSGASQEAKKLLALAEKLRKTAG